jgi:hypothetical protein
MNSSPAALGSSPPPTENIFGTMLMICWRWPSSGDGCLSWPLRSRIGAPREMPAPSSRPAIIAWGRPIVLRTPSASGTCHDAHVGNPSRNSRPLVSKHLLRSSRPSWKPTAAPVWTQLTLARHSSLKSGPLRVKRSDERWPRFARFAAYELEPLAEWLDLRKLCQPTVLRVFIPWWLRGVSAVRGDSGASYGPCGPSRNTISTTWCSPRRLPRSMTCRGCRRKS